MQLIRKTGLAVSDAIINERAPRDYYAYKTKDFHNELKSMFGKELTAENVSKVVELIHLLEWRLRPAPWCHVCGREISYEDENANPFDFVKSCPDHAAFRPFVNLELTMADAGVDHGPCVFHIDWSTGQGGIYISRSRDEMIKAYGDQYGAHRWLTKAPDGTFYRTNRNI